MAHSVEPLAVKSIPMQRIAAFAAGLGLALSIAACDTTINPRTGESNVRFTLPGTAANEAAFREQWERCVAFGSQSQCAKRFGGRTPSNTFVPPEEHP